MNDEDTFMPFEVCSIQDKQHSLSVRSGKKPHTIIYGDNQTAHSAPDKFDVHMSHDGSLSIQGTFFFNIFKS